MRMTAFCRVLDGHVQRLPAAHHQPAGWPERHSDALRPLHMDRISSAAQFWGLPNLFYFCSRHRPMVTGSSTLQVVRKKVSIAATLLRRTPRRLPPHLPPRPPGGALFERGRVKSSPGKQSTENKRQCSRKCHGHGQGMAMAMAMHGHGHGLAMAMAIATAHKIMPRGSF